MLYIFVSYLINSNYFNAKIIVLITVIMFWHCHHCRQLLYANQPIIISMRYLLTKKMQT